MRRVVLTGLIAPLLAAFAASSQAQTWPGRAVSIVVPFSAGSTMDVTTRLLAEQVSKQTGQPFVIENRGGAGGTIAIGQVAKAAPDGHTIVATGNLGTTYALYANLPYDPLRDFLGAILFASQPLVVVTGASAPYKTLADLVVAGKAKPGSLNYASAGVGTVTHLASERLRLSAGFEAQHVPFKGPTEGLAEVMAGRIHFYTVPIPSAVALVKDGKLRALAVTAQKRAPLLPDVPTTIELGLKDSDYALFSGLFVPAKTPPGVVQRIHAEAARALDSPAVKERFRALGAEAPALSQAAFDKYFRDDVAANVALVKAAGIRIQK